MSNNPVANPQLTNFNIMDSTTYKSAIDGNFAVLQREAGKFAPQQNIITINNLVLDPGHLFNGTTLTQYGAYGLVNTTNGSAVIAVQGGASAMNGIQVGMAVLPLSPTFGNVIGSINSGAAVITGITTSTAWPVGATVTGPNIPASTTILSVTNGAITLSNNATGNVTNGSFLIQFTNPLTQSPVVASISGNNVTVSSSTGFPNSTLTLSGFPVKFCLVTGLISPVITNPRIDRVVLDASAGTVSVVTGTESVTPTAPAIPTGKYPIAQVLMTSTTSGTITNSMIYDERDFSQSLNGQTPPVGDNTTKQATTAFVNSFLPTNGSLTVTSSTVLTNVTNISQLLSLIGGAGTYFVEGWGFVTVGSATPGFKMGLAYTGTTSGQRLTGTLDNGGALTGGFNTGSIGGIVTSTNATSAVFRFEGIITIATAGTLTMTFAQNVSNATSSVLVNAVLRVTPSIV